jgi:predicted DNA binding CopG/RHH family protein
MMKKKKYTLEDVKKMTKSITRTEEDAMFTDIYGNKIDIDEAIEQAEKDVEKLKTINVNFRWSQHEIERAKKIAEKKGLKYQTYIKSTLKQQMDKDEKELAS